MSIPGRNINPTISVDCVIFGFSTNQLKVLLIERSFTDRSGIESKDYKLPGDFISINEDLDLAASRTLEEMTGLRDIFLCQFAVFGKPDRISNPVDMEWLLETTGLEIQRVVTAAYYSLINIGETNTDFAIKNSASWIDVKQIPKLAFDHADIIEQGLIRLQLSLRSEPIGFEMLPEKFTIRDLQILYEAILDCTLDNRNFRKKILKSSYLVQLDEKQTGVAHKPAHYYRFDRYIYEKHKKESLGFNF
ncbi:MAG: NUDIX domain-containing protein [Bacteroidia bacterium]|nr:MAG: NUDIX domain-containing protein [Bacteroidia bacterium]